MELISLAKEGLQNVAEFVASYRIGQTVLRHLDRALWVIEKSARWAVPPPLDQDDRPQPELVRPLPWVFFLMLLITLRITRESISLINLVLGKPPLRSADVVTYIQSKRRYLRTLKYQGNRIMRSRSGPNQEPWYSGVWSLFEFTMCFRRASYNYGNNNTTHVSNNEEVLVVKRSKRGREDLSSSPTASRSESTMERLIEKMMIDLDADSDDSSYTLTNITNPKSDSDGSEPENETINMKTPNEHNDSSEITFNPLNSDAASSTPEKNGETEVIVTPKNNGDTTVVVDKNGQASPNVHDDAQFEDASETCDMKTKFGQEDSVNFISHERSPQKTQVSPKKMANGRTVKSTPNKRKAALSGRRNSDVPVVRITSTDDV